METEGGRVWTGGTWSRNRLTRWKLQQTVFLLVVLVPMIIIFLVFWVYPLLGGIWGSFTLWRAFDPNKPFVGLRHYLALSNDPIFLTALGNTFYYALLYLPVSIILALLLALAIEATGVFRGVFRMIYFIPVV